MTNYDAVYRIFRPPPRANPEPTERAVTYYHSTTVWCHDDTRRCLYSLEAFVGFVKTCLAFEARVPQCVAVLYVVTSTSSLDSQHHGRTYGVGPRARHSRRRRPTGTEIRFDGALSASGKCRSRKRAKYCRLSFELGLNIERHCHIVYSKLSTKIDTAQLASPP